MALLGLGFSGMIRAAKREVDRLAVIGARETVAGLFYRGRQEAIAHGGARVFIRAEPPVVKLMAGADTLITSSLAEEFGITLGLSRGRPEALLRFGPLGLGLVSSQTLTFRRGNTESLLVISGLGRVDRR